MLREHIFSQWCGMLPLAHTDTHLTFAQTRIHTILMVRGLLLDISSVVCLPEISQEEVFWSPNYPQVACRRGPLWSTVGRSPEALMQADWGRAACGGWETGRVVLCAAVWTFGVFAGTFSLLLHGGLPRLPSFADARSPDAPPTCLVNSCSLSPVFIPVLTPPTGGQRVTRPRRPGFLTTACWCSQSFAQQGLPRGETNEGPDPAAPVLRPRGRECWWAELLPPRPAPGKGPLLIWLPNIQTGPGIMGPLVSVRKDEVWPTSSFWKGFSRTLKTLVQFYILRLCPMEPYPTHLLMSLINQVLIMVLRAIHNTANSPSISFYLYILLLMVIDVISNYASWKCF